MMTVENHDQSEIDFGPNLSKTRKQQLQELISTMLVFVSDYLQPALESSSLSVFSDRLLEDKRTIPIVSSPLLHAVKDLPQNIWDVFDDILKDIAKNGIIWCPWPFLRLIIATKVEYIFSTLLNSRRSRMLLRHSRGPDDLQSLRQSMVHLWNLQIPPFTTQRAAEVVVSHHQYRDPRKLAFALTKVLGSATLPISRVNSPRLELLFPNDLPSLLSTLTAAGPLRLQTRLTRFPGQKVSSRLSSTSSLISSLSTPIPSRKRFKETNDSADDQLDTPMEASNLDDASFGRFWHNQSSNEDEDVTSIEAETEEEDAEEQFDKSNSDYILSLPDTLPISHMYKNNKQGKYDNNKIPSKVFKKKQEEEEVIQQQQQQQQSSSSGLRQPEFSKGGSSITELLLKDLDDENDNNELHYHNNNNNKDNRSNAAASPSNIYTEVIQTKSVFNTNRIPNDPIPASTTGIGLLSEYFDDNDEDIPLSLSDTKAEAMKLLSDSLGKSHQK